MVDCPTQRSGFFLDVYYTTAQTNYTGGLLTFNVIIDFGGPISRCAPTVGEAARVADDCTPPSHARITKAIIRRHTAFFRFKARHATSFLVTGVGKGVDPKSAVKKFRIR